MRHTLLFLFASLILSLNINAQDTDTTAAWTKGGNVTFLLQQVGVRNWAGGGESSISYGSQVGLFANRAVDRHTWNNSLEAAYGLIKKKGLSPVKSVDFLILKSKYGNYITDDWQVSGALDFRTQFTPGYAYQKDAATNIEYKSLISDFLAPGYFQAMIGLTYKPNPAFYFTVAPLSNKLTIVLNDSLSAAGAFGVDPGEKLNYEFGASISTGLEKQLIENVNLKTNLLLFADYSELSHVDIMWDLFIDMKVNKWLSTNFALQMIYDHDIDIVDAEGKIGPRTQIRNVLNVGIAFWFGDKLE